MDTQITIKFYDCNGNALNCSQPSLDYLPLSTFEFIESPQIEAAQNENTDQLTKYKLGSIYIENNNVVHVCILDTINSYCIDSDNERAYAYLPYVLERFKPRNIKFYNINYPHPLNDVINSNCRLKRFYKFFNFTLLHDVNVEIIP